MNLPISNQNYFPYRVLAIGGSDSGGSAGIQADLKTYEARSVFGTSVITLVTAQNTLGVQHAMPIPLELIEQQLNSVLSDIGTNAFKTGLLGRKDVVELVANRVKSFKATPLVVDPVLVNGRGNPIVTVETIQAYQDVLFPLATVITPNIDEARRLTNMDSIQNLGDCYTAARRLYDFGVKTILIKGGHLGTSNMITDLFFDGVDFIELTAPTLPVHNPHGVGCTFASAIAAELAKGNTPFDAVQTAHSYLQDALRGALDWHVGQGRTPVNHHVGSNKNY
jgi:hydroxymethylpyrimidine/phosphomethylpyrimidine kinase